MITEAVEKLEGLLDPSQSTPTKEGAGVEELEALELDLDESREPSPEESPSEEAPLDEGYEIVHNGKTYKLAKDKLIELAQKGFDYTKKTQNLSEDSRRVEDSRRELEALARDHEALSAYYSTYYAASNQLSAYKDVDWTKLEEDDPTGYLKHRDQFRELERIRDQALQQVSFEKSKASELQNRALSFEIERNVGLLKKDIPQWGNDLYGKLIDYGTNSGFEREEIASVVDARAIKILHKAYLYDQLRKSKSDKKVSELPKVQRPGGGHTEALPKEELQPMKQRLVRSGRVDDAARVLERMLRKK